MNQSTSHSSRVQAAVDLIADTKTQINLILNDPAYVHNLLTINSALDRLKTQLGFMGTVVVDESAPKHEFKPMTTFMGEKITRAKMITKEELNPHEIERKAFVAKVVKLQTTIHNMSNDIILKSYTIPDDVAVLRGVAKRAGITDYMDHELNNEFINNIKAGLIAIDENRNAQQAADAQLGAINTPPTLQTAPTQPTGTIALTEDELLKQVQAERKAESPTIVASNITDDEFIDDEDENATSPEPIRTTNTPNPNIKVGGGKNHRR